MMWATPVGPGDWMCSWVSNTRQTVRSSFVNKDPRFPDGSPYQSVSSLTNLLFYQTKLLV